MRIYLDAPPVIYIVQRVPPYLAIVQQYLAQPGIELVASDVTRLECRVEPLRRADHVLLANFDRYFASVHEFVPLSRAVMDRATEVRATYGFRTPDAIHIAAALVSQCDVFLTNDQRLSRVQGIQVQIVQ